ncbi:MAG: STAS domain-containing protein [Phycisphaerae bacterium]|jgi:anti-anti-sigma factor
MGIQNWSDEITVVELMEDPQFSEDLEALASALEAKTTDVVLNFSTVGFINSSNIAALLRVRKLLHAGRRRMVLCGISPHAWGLFQVTGLDKTFEFTQDVSTALATIQLSPRPE